jgi:membrane protein YqaA with SNARE-associated domain
MKLDSAALIRTWGLPAATYTYCLASGLVPFINAEVFLVIVSSTLLPRSQLLLITALAALGQMSAKCLLYAGIRTSFRRPPHKYEVKLALARTKLARWRYGAGGFLFVSATTGFPPLYATSILAGLLKMDFLTFLVCGLAGRFIRFGTVLVFPQLVKKLF